MDVVTVAAKNVAIAFLVHYAEENDALEEFAGLVNKKNDSKLIIIS